MNINDSKAAMEETEIKLAKKAAVFGLIVCVIGVILTHRYTFFVPTSATIIEFKERYTYNSHHDRDNYDDYRYSMVFQYTVNGKIYRYSDYTNTRYEVGDTIRVKYNPLNPIETTLSARHGLTNMLMWFGAIVLVASLIYLIRYDR